MEYRLFISGLYVNKEYRIGLILFPPSKTGIKYLNYVTL